MKAVEVVIAAQVPEEETRLFPASVGLVSLV
jgi:hypothetical protein